jgi:acyl-CoA dehydrogenase
MEKLIAEHMAGENIIVETSMAKYWSTDLANRMANRALDIVGEEGARESCLLTRACATPGSCRSSPAPTKS